MDTIYVLVRSTQAIVATQPTLGWLRRWWDGLLERYERRTLRARLCDLSERELQDIGTTRGEIDYVAANRASDPRSVMHSQ
jgi:uncharacterized protein YjiS (DUF1127 family)